MNVVQNSDDPVLPMLRPAAVQWLEALRLRITQQALFPELYPNDPDLLPANFPMTVGLP